MNSRKAVSVQPLNKHVVSLSATNILASVQKIAIMLDCTSAKRKKKLKLHSDGGDSGSKKYKRRYVDAYVEVWRSLRLAGVWSEAVGFVLVRLAGIWLQPP
jgi:hypothetical protein